jgi:hypothetical protein
MKSVLGGTLMGGGIFCFVLVLIEAEGVTRRVEAGLALYAAIIGFSLLVNAFSDMRDAQRQSPESSGALQSAPDH